VIRLTFLWLVILGILGYSWKDWYRGICGLIILMAVIEHPDMPKSILGIPGLNPWNLLLLNGILAWWSQRGQEGLRFDLPRPITILLVLYLLMVLFGFARIIGDTRIIERYYQANMTYFFNDYVINTVKWVIPGLLLYDGCRTEERFRLAVFSILSVFVLLGIQVAKWMPPSYALDGGALERRSLKVLVKGIGYHRVNLSAMLSGASWAIICTAPLLPKGTRWMALVTGCFVVYAQMMTGGRAGYVAWVAVGLVMCVLKWRRYLLLIPAAGLLAIVFLPGVVGRATEGFTADSHDTNKRLEQQKAQQLDGGGDTGEVDSYTVTAGRSLAWPLVIDKIMKQPLIGYGRQAMLRTGIATYLYDTLGEIFPHPHNAYLELLLDNGLIGFVIVITFYSLMLFNSIRLFLDRDSPSCSAIGGVSTALMLGMLVSGMGSQTFYPREGWDGMWAAMLLGLRVRMERKRLAAAPAAPVAAPAEVQDVRTFARPALAPSPVTVGAGAWSARRTAAVGHPSMPAAASPAAARPAAARPAAARATLARPAAASFAPRRSAVQKPILENHPPPQPHAAPAAAPRGGGFHRPSPARATTRIPSSGLFGTKVIDPLVWETP
jgi:O-antigen ligase